MTVSEPEPECVSAGDVTMSGGGIVVMWWSPTPTISYTGNIHNLKNNFHEMFWTLSLLAFKAEIHIFYNYLD